MLCHLYNYIKIESSHLIFQKCLTPSLVYNILLELITNKYYKISILNIILLNFY